MKNTLFRTLLLAVLFIPAAQSLHASSHVKKVQLALRNDSGTSMEFMVGNDVVTLDAGKTVALNILVETRIVLDKANSTHAAGELIAEVSKDLDGATLHVK
jgi:hypothetical protein